MSFRSAHRESGAILVLSIPLILVFLFFGFLVLDVLRVEKVARALQRTADAMALAATLELKPSGDETSQQNGWRNAKRAAIGYLRMNPVYVAEQLVPATANTLCCPASGEASSSECDESVVCICKCGESEAPVTCNVSCSYAEQDDQIAGNSSYAPIQFSYGEAKFIITIERGFWTETSTFYPLERWALKNGALSLNANTTFSGGELFCVPNPPGPGGVPDTDCPAGTQVWKIANASRVTMTLKDISTFLGSLPYIGIASTPEITREAFAHPDWVH